MGGTSPHTSEPVSSLAAVVAVALIAVQLFPFWKRFPFVHSSGHSSQSTGYYKQIKHLVDLVVCQILDRFPVASRVRAALCSLSVRLHRLFTDCLKLFSRKSRFFACAISFDLCPVPSMRSTSSCGGGWVVSVQLLPVRIPDTLPAAVGQLLGCRCILLAYTVGK